MSKWMKIVYAWIVFSGIATTWCQDFPPIRLADRLLIHEAMKLKEAIGDSIWPGWSQTPFTLLLVTEQHEYLVRHPAPSKDFVRLGYDSLLATDVYVRARTYSKEFLATFPAVSGVQTIVVGTPEQTGKSSMAWVVTLLHEHFHQYQYTHSDYYPRVGQLNLSGGDQSGMWMLTYPFPYNEKQTVALFGDFLKWEAMAVKSSGFLEKYLSAKKRLQCGLSSRDYRYLNFQLWQEGLARYTEICVAEFAARHRFASTEMSGLPDFRPYEQVAGDLRSSVLNGLRDVQSQKRIVFYSVGAAEGLLLDASGRSWRDKYFDAFADTDRLFEYTGQVK